MNSCEQELSFSLSHLGDYICPVLCEEAGPRQCHLMALPWSAPVRRRVRGELHCTMACHEILLASSLENRTQTIMPVQMDVQVEFPEVKIPHGLGWGLSPCCLGLAATPTVLSDPSLTLMGLMGRGKEMAASFLSWDS